MTAVKNWNLLPMKCSRKESSWQLIPDFTSLRYVVQLFGQGLRVNTMKDRSAGM